MRHGDIRDNGVGLVFLRRLYQRPPVGDDGDHVKVRGQHHAQSLDDHAVIIGQYDGWTCHDDSPVSGTHATMVVPWPGVLSISSSPPSRRVRSSIPARPRLGWLRWIAGSKPIPSS